MSSNDAYFAWLEGVIRDTLIVLRSSKNPAFDKLYNIVNSLGYTLTGDTLVETKSVDVIFSDFFTAPLTVRHHDQWWIGPVFDARCARTLVTVYQLVLGYEPLCDYNGQYNSYNNNYTIEDLFPLNYLQEHVSIYVDDPGVRYDIMGFLFIRIYEAYWGLHYVNTSGNSVPASTRPSEHCIIPKGSSYTTSRNVNIDGSSFYVKIAWCTNQFDLNYQGSGQTYPYDVETVETHAVNLRTYLHLNNQRDSSIGSTVRLKKTVGLPLDTTERLLKNTTKTLETVEYLLGPDERELATGVWTLVPHTISLESHEYLANPTPVTIESDEKLVKEGHLYPEARMYLHGQENTVLGVYLYLEPDHKNAIWVDTEKYFIQKIRVIAPDLWYDLLDSRDFNTY